MTRRAATAAATPEVASALRSGALPVRALTLLARADGELVAAQMSGQPWERFLHAHLAALRAGAAVLAVRGAPGGRGAPKDVWGGLDRVAPELAGWSATFAQGARLRAAAEAGMIDRIGAGQADQTLGTAQAMVDAVRELLVPSGVAARGEARAS